MFLEIFQFTFLWMMAWFDQSHFQSP